MKEVYIESIVTSSSENLDIKSLIPDANMRRRMTALNKCATMIGIAAIKLSNITPETIITATGYGFLNDSEKFLNDMLSSEQLSPTPFIQSTFNTVGSNVATITKNNSANITYVNGYQSFADALLDAQMRLCIDDCKAILIIAFDEVTDTVLNIAKRIDKNTQRPSNNISAVAMVITANKTERSVAHYSVGNLQQINIHQHLTIHTAELAIKLASHICDGKLDNPLADYGINVTLI